MNELTENMESRREFYAAIIDSSEDAIISKDLNGVITSWNKSAERMFGYTAEEIIGKHVSILIPLDRYSEEELIISHLRSGKRIEHYETIRLRKSGSEIPISLTVSPVMNADGVVIGASKIARDITRQKQAEEMVSLYTRQLEILNSVAKTIAAEIEMNSILQRVTDITTELSGAAFGAFFYNKTDSKGEAFMLYALSGAPREAFERFGMPRNTAVFGKTFRGEGILRSDDITADPRYGKNAPHAGMPVGHLPVVSYMAVPVISPNGTVIGGLFFGHPEKGVFRAEHERLLDSIAGLAAVALDKAKLYEEVQLLNSKKDDFIGFASHELKTPLTTINGYLQLAESLPHLSRDFLPKIRKQVTRLSAIIGDLLDISKIEAGVLELNYSTVPLKTLIKDSIETVKALSVDHVIEYASPPEELMLKVDSQKIGQVLINLLTNALKYSPNGSQILLDAAILGDQIRICIQDHGQGIAPEHLENIFNRFYRVTEQHSKTEGLGLGLYLSKAIIEAHHGRIWVESEQGKGSSFFIEFPIGSAIPTGD